MALFVPTVHLNGTSYDELLKQQRDVIRACDALTEALSKAMPHGRDFYPQGNHGEPARENTRVWIGVVDKLRTETYQRAEAIIQQKER